jgi:hypothetical protein
MGIKLGNLHTADYSMEYELSLEELAREQLSNPAAAQTPVTVEQVLRGDAEMLNIARNLANQPDVKIDPADYIDMVKEEMIQKGQLGKENYIDEWKKARSDSKEAVIINENETGDKKEEETKSVANEMASKYSGPTRIYYNLPGRVHSYLPIPIYKCEGSGKVSLRITVSPKGVVTEAIIIESESTTSDQCLTETAVRSALSSRFNADAKILKNQQGTIAYHFVAQ